MSRLAASRDEGSILGTIAKLVHLSRPESGRMNILLSRIEELMALDEQRLATIAKLKLQLAEKSSAIAEAEQRPDESPDELSARLERMRRLDEQRLDKISELSATVERLTVLDKERVAKITEMAAQDTQRQAQIDDLQQRLLAMDASLHETDGIRVHGRNLSFLDEPRFASAWEKARAANVEGWPGPAGVPDVRWRAHVVLWAAQQGLPLEGDFVECGVHTGLFSLVVFNALDLGPASRRFFLFDTFNGIPLDRLEGDELARARAANEHYYSDVWSVAQRNFAPFPQAKLIRGALPGTVATAELGKIAFLSMDLNNAIAERETIELLWDRIVPGAVIVLDDYAWEGHENQFEMWNSFAASKGLPIAALPTGQGLIIKR